jgi:hypothetical protein
MTTALDDLVDDWLAKPKDNGKVPLDYGVSIGRAPAGVEFGITAEDRAVIVRSGFRHAVRAGKLDYAHGPTRSLPSTGRFRITARPSRRTRSCRDEETVAVWSWCERTRSTVTPHAPWCS